MPNEQELRKHRCCFTGHRPEKLHKPEEQIKKDLEVAILQAVDDGLQRLFSGFGNPILLSTLWRHHPIVGLKADGLRIGNRGTMPFCSKPIW